MNCCRWTRWRRHSRLRICSVHRRSSSTAQLLVWQKEVVHRLDVEAAVAWLGERLPADLPGEQRQAFVAAVLPNVVLPDDVLPWVEVAFGD